MDLIKVCESKIQRMAIDVFYSGKEDFEANLKELENEIERFWYLKGLRDEISKKEKLRRSIKL